ncbi:Gfo/Idh/MocA family oxidoreductase [Streptococcus iniae]
MLDIGLIGLGGIAQKAYLPYMRQLKDVHWHISTRDNVIREQVDNLFGNSTIYTDVNQLVNVSLDGVFIHASNKSAFYFSFSFLKAGIPVYMDKPLTESFEETQHLYDLAKANNTFLMAGFNRRFAPRLSDLKELASKKRIIVEKNDVNSVGHKVFKLFDFFIHPLDTALFLSDEKPLRGRFRYHLENQLLSHVSVSLETASSQIIVGMNLQSGSRREVMEVQTPEATGHLENLDELTIYKGTDKEVKAFGSWDTTLYKRGFETVINSFLEAVKSGVNPVNVESSLMSHWLCHQIAQSSSEHGELDITLPN